MPTHKWDYKMNEKPTTSLIKKIKDLLDELESEVGNHPEDYVPRKVTYSDVLMYEECNNDDDYQD